MSDNSRTSAIHNDGTPSTQETKSSPINLQGGDTPIGPIHHVNPLDLPSMHPYDRAYPIGA